MSSRTQIEPKRVVHYAEASFSQRSAKMSVGVIRYGVHESVAVIDSQQVGKTSQEVIGSGGNTPIVASLDDAMKFNPEVFFIGTTPVGGRLNEELRQVTLAAIGHGLEIHAGLHDFLCNDKQIAAAAAAKGVKLVDLRKPAPDLPVGKGRVRLAKSYVCLTVGSDAAIGKMTTALELQREMVKNGTKAEFVATGQTGIAIAGWGSAIDAVAGDFIAGAVEKDIQSVDGEAEVILVEGQGSLLHPGFSSVTLGLMHGACPHSIILQHQLTRNEVSKMETPIPIPSLDKVAKLYLDLLAPIRPSELVAVAFNSSGSTAEELAKAIVDAEALLGVPADDPVRNGPAKLAAAVEAHRRKLGM